MAANILAYIWKWLPFWTLIFLSARMAIPKEIYEAAAIDGASSIQQTVHVTFPLMANVYLVATLSLLRSCARGRPMMRGVR